MNKRDAENRIKILKQQLQLMVEQEKDFLRHLSNPELQARKDEILDELKVLLDFVKSIDSSN